VKSYDFLVETNGGIWWELPRSYFRTRILEEGFDAVKAHDSTALVGGPYAIANDPYDPGGELADLILKDGHLTRPLDFVSFDSYSSTAGTIRQIDTLAKFLFHPGKGFCTAGRVYCVRQFWIEEYGSADARIACGAHSKRTFLNPGADAVAIADVCRRTSACGRIFLFSLYSQQLGDGYALLTGYPDVVPVDNKCTSIAEMLGGQRSYRDERRGAVPDPPGSYQQTCSGRCTRGIKVNGVEVSTLTAGACRRKDGSTTAASISLPCATGISNCDGALVCGGCP